MCACSRDWLSALNDSQSACAKGSRPRGRSGGRPIELRLTCANCIFRKIQTEDYMSLFSQTAGSEPSTGRPLFEEPQRQLLCGNAKLRLAPTVEQAARSLGERARRAHSRSDDVENPVTEPLRTVQKRNPEGISEDYPPIAQVKASSRIFWSPYYIDFVPVYNKHISIDPSGSAFGG